MSSSPPPTKPPRGMKQSRETSGILMSVIRTLSASETNEQREKERAKLEKEYKKSDSRLDELVAENASEIMAVMEKFNVVNEALASWGHSCDSAVARLTTCQNLLELRSDDLRRLWTDARTHHHALQMLSDIERVVTSEKEIRDALAAGRVLNAATILNEALMTADKSLAHVHALNNTRQHLQAKKSEVVDIIVKNLSNMVYCGDPDPMVRRPSARKRLVLLLTELSKPDEVTEDHLQDITPEYEASLTEEEKTFETVVLISLEALGVLDQLKEATEKFKVQIQSNLLQVIETISKRTMEETDTDADDLRDTDGQTDSETSGPITKLVSRLSEEFKACADRNKRLIQFWRAVLKKYQVSDSTLHTEQNYWSAVQQVMQLLLTEYLEIESVTLEAQRSTITNNIDVNQNLKLADYFAKKKVQRRRPKLFTITGSKIMTEKRGERNSRITLICTPSPSHLTAFLAPLRLLTLHIESLTGGGECSLRAFLTDYVRCGESVRLANQARTEIDKAFAAGAWRERKKSESGHWLCHGVYSSHLAIQALLLSASVASWCGSPLSALLSAIAHTHSHVLALKLCSGAAARWLADDDIVRFLQTLPNWRAATSNDTIIEDKQLSQELKQAYIREAEILGSSLVDGSAIAREIVRDPAQLNDIAIMCESLDWLSAKVRTLPSTLSTGSSGVKMNDKISNEIIASADALDQLAQKYLLFLHLELRIQCYHYLCDENQSESEDSETGGSAKLAHSLLTFHEQAIVFMAERRLKYIMHGLAEMMSAAVISRCQGSSISLVPLATLRHCLAGLHLSHSGLHAASDYLAMLHLTPEEIITSIKEKGAQFSELEYLNAFKVIGNKRGLSQSDMKIYLKQLSTALGHLGVTV